MDAAQPQHRRHKIKTRRRSRRLIGPRPREKKVIMCHGTFDLVHPGTPAPPDLRQEQGRHPGRQPDRRRPHHRRPTTARSCRRTARHEPGGLRSASTTWSSTRTRRRSRTSRSSSPTISPRATSTAKGGIHPRTARGEGGRRVLRRRGDLHAGRRRLFLLAHHRERAADDRHRQAAHPDGVGEAQLRRPAAAVLQTFAGVKVHVDRRHDRRLATPTAR